VIWVIVAGLAALFLVGVWIEAGTRDDDPPDRWNRRPPR